MGHRCLLDARNTNPETRAYLSTYYTINGSMDRKTKDNVNPAKNGRQAIEAGVTSVRAVRLQPSSLAGMA